MKIGRPARIVSLFVALAATTIAAQSNRIDGTSPYAPELAGFGEHAIGVRTFQVTARNRPDIVNTKPGAPVVRYDRTLTLEVWYPARLIGGQQPGGEYRMITRDPSITAVLHGRAVRDAAPLDTGSPAPLVVISHGYPGNRYLLSHLAESLASKGFVVVSIDHKDSTYDDQQTFASTLYNRPFDQLFVVSEIERLGRAGSGSFLSGRVDAGRSGIVGYSMGGYGALNVIGAGYSDASVASQSAPPDGLLRERAASNPAYRSARDPRIRAVIAIGPWGMPAGFWDAEGLKGIQTPLLVVAGSVDDVAGYREGPRAIWEGAANADRYLLTFVNAGHNAAAPIPAPVETYEPRDPSRSAPFTHYADPVWDTVRMNNILQHFATAFFEWHLKDRTERRRYLDVVPDPSTAVFSMNDGAPNPDHTYWPGFARRTATGLLLERREAGR